MRVVVTGATGLIGSAVVQLLRHRGDDVVALTRDARRGRATLGTSVDLAEWPEPERKPPPVEALQDADAVVHLLGEPVAQRWTASAKQRIRDSRVLGTRSLVAGLQGLGEDRRPGTLISQSATGYYGPRGEEEVSETTPPGDDFLARVTVEWEGEAQAATPAMRVVIPRTGVVVASSGGALAKMLPFFRLGIGGPVAGGRQYVPWIHLDDVAGAVAHCLDEPRIAGPVNLTAPNPVTNRELSRTLGRVLHRPAVLPVPGVALHLLYGEMASIVTTGHRVIPGRLRACGYEYIHAELEPALREVVT